MEIDGVFSGGGIRGLAIIGALEIIENKGFTFKRVAGTSAGSIIAGFVAAGYRSKEIKDMVNAVNYKELLDHRASWFPIPSQITKWLFLYWRLGMYKGNALEEWLKVKLGEKGVYTFSDLPKGSLRLVASDLTNGRMLVLPDDLVHYGIPLDSFPVAKAVRMSCSLPYFFEPIHLRGLDGKSIIVDGGVLSNFPMWLFVKDDSKKTRPVIGITLSPKQSEHPKHKIKNGVQLFEALFETMKEAHDARYISRRHEKNIIFIPTENYCATDFLLSLEKKDALMEIGRNRAKDFLKSWSY